MTRHIVRGIPALLAPVLLVAGGPAAMAQPGEQMSPVDEDALVEEDLEEVPSPDEEPAPAPQEPGEEVSEGVEEPVEAVPDTQGEEYATVVTAARLPEDPFLSDRTVDVVGSADLEEASAKSLPEALWDSPGVFVQHTNYGGGSPIMRGFIGPQLLILIDGVRFSNSVYRTGPLQYLNLIDPLAMESVELLHGPGSVLYGSDAMGGVIQAFPVQPSLFGGGLDGHGELLVRYATASSGKTGHVGLDVGAGGFGISSTMTLMGLGDLDGGGGVGTQVYSGYDQWSVSGALMHRFTQGRLDGSWVKLAVLATSIDDAGRTDKLFDRGSLQLYDNKDVLTWGRLHLDLDRISTSADLTLSFQHFYELKDALSMNPDLVTWTSATRDETEVLTMGVDLAMSTGILGGRMWFNYGGMWYHDGVHAERHERTADTSWESQLDVAYPDGSSYSNYGLYALVGGDPLRLDSGHVLRLKGGYRFHGMSADAPAQLDLPEVMFDSIGHVGLAGIQYVYRDRATVAFTFSQGFRAPNLQESAMLGDTGKFFHVPNDNLAPERVDTFELLARGRFWRITLSWTGSVSLVHDLIKRVPTTWRDQEVVGGKDVYHNVNANEGLIVSTGGWLHVDLPVGFSLYGHVTWTWGEERIEGEPNEPLTRIPPLFGLISLRWDAPSCPFGNAFIETYVRFAGKQDRLSAEDEKDARIPEGGTDRWITWNARAGIELVDHARLSLVLENWTDEKYKYHGSGVWSPGLNFVTSLELFF